MCAYDMYSNFCLQNQNPILGNFLVLSPFLRDRLEFCPQGLFVLCEQGRAFLSGAPKWCVNDTKVT
jgi:hypothetical protein